MDSNYQVVDNLEIDWTECPYSSSSSNAEEKSKLRYIAVSIKLGLDTEL